MVVLLLPFDPNQHHLFCLINPCLNQMVWQLVGYLQVSLDCHQAMSMFNLSVHLQTSLHCHRVSFILPHVAAITSSIVLGQAAPIAIAATAEGFTALVASFPKVISLVLCLGRQLRPLVHQHLVRQRPIDHLPLALISDLGR